MRIAELAQLVGIAPSAVRWYEQADVLPPPLRGHNGYRTYSEADVARLRLVVALRRLGLAPREAGHIAHLVLEGGEPGEDVAAVLDAQRAAIARQRAHLDRLEAELIDLDNTLAATSRARSTKPVATSTQGNTFVQPIRVLFLCTHNSARSQLAEALLGHYGGEAFLVRSAGTEETRVNPYAVRVLAEMGIDWSAARSKMLTEFTAQPWDYVITVCDRARQSCPVFPGAVNSLHWGLDDPSEVVGSDEDRLAAFRRTAAEVGVRLRPFIEIALRAAGRPVRPLIAE